MAKKARNIYVSMDIIIENVLFKKNKNAIR